MNKEKFVLKCDELGIKITDKMLDKLDKYYELLISWNEKINLTGITNYEDVYLKHFYDSLCIVKSINLNDNLTLCDVGTGAGFPGIVLKIVFDNLNITLIEPIKKRCLFLETVIQELNLNNIKVINERAEVYAKENREIFDIVTCRAVSHLSIISEISIPLLKINGLFLPLKSDIKEEIKVAKNILKILNSEIIKIIEYKLPVEDSKRTIIKIKKLKKTNQKYPRNYSQIKKNFNNGN